MLDPDSVQAEVASSPDNGLHQWCIRIADGAIWQMAEGVLTIRKGALGSVLMDADMQAAVRARRVRRRE